MDQNISSENLVPQALYSLYNTIYDIDLANDTYVEYRSVPYFHKQMEDVTSARILLGGFTFILEEEDRKRALDLGNSAKLEKKLKNGEYLFEEFHSRMMGWIKVVVIPLERDEDDHITRVLFCSQDINAEKEYFNKATQTSRDIKTMSQLSRMLFSYDLTVDMETGEYTLIEGNGLEECVEILRNNTDVEEALEQMAQLFVPFDTDKIRNAFMKDGYFGNIDTEGYKGTLEYPMTYIADGRREWHQINVFIKLDEDGHKVADILCRDVTGIHEKEEQSARELKAAAAGNKVLSDLTKMIYGYNLMVNLTTGKFSLIEGTGMEHFVEILRSTDDYEDAFGMKLNLIQPEYADRFREFIGMDALRAASGKTGFIGRMEYGTVEDEGSEWHEVNVLISLDEYGDKVANILGRNITEEHNRAEEREKRRRASVAKDQLLSSITRMLYSFNINLNLNTWKYTLIMGNSYSEAIAEAGRGDKGNYEVSFAKIRTILKPEYREIFDGLVSPEALKKVYGRSGYIGTVTVSSYYKERTTWQETNLFLSANENGETMANILVRDTTELHRQQEEKEQETRAAMARDQLLSGITKMLYGFNLTVDPYSGNFSVIAGSGMEKQVEKMEQAGDYYMLYESLIHNFAPEDQEKADTLLSPAALREGVNSTGRLYSKEIRYIDDGQIRWHEINAFSGYDGEGTPVINLLGRDVTEAHDRADTKAQLEIANAANEAKTSFLFNMSHDIRTPMNAIIGFTDLLEKNQTDPERRQDYIGKIKQSSSILLSIINNVLEMARIEKGKISLDESAWNCEQFNDTLFAMFNEMMKEKGLKFTRSVNVQHKYVYCDPIKLREVFLNILSNAHKYTPSGSVSFDLTEIPSDRPGYVLYRTTVSDTGIGMSEEFLPHIFDEFSREHTSTENKVVGTGLGMPIVKRLLDLMGGDIEVQSRLGEGTVFTVTIPHRIALEEDVTDQSIREEPEEVVFEGKRILLAEDNDLNAEIAMVILEEAGFAAERAIDGEDCVHMMETHDPGYYDLILMDIQMPGMNGYDATRAIRKLDDTNKSSIPIIAMTANAFEEDKKNAFNAGMNGHLAKPIVVRDLMQTLATTLS